MSSPDDTAALIDRALQAIDEAEVRTGVQLSREQPDLIASGRTDTAHAIGERSIADLCAAFDLDPATLIDKGVAEGERRAVFLLAALGINPAHVEAQTLSIVKGACASGVFVGTRIGLLIADARAREAGR